MPNAFFKFEASSSIGAGHAIRSCVLADALVEEAWTCCLVTSQDSYDFIPGLDRFERVDPQSFYDHPPKHNLLVIDQYDLGQEYEKHFRGYTDKILVIDDLANRMHECDILLDQTYGRVEEEYKHLVPETCKILTGGDYVLLRKEFIEMRPKALKKRQKTKEIKRILISMGGNDLKNYTLSALEMVKQSGFEGAVDIALGFKAPHLDAIKAYTQQLSNNCKIHINGDMPRLIYDADLAIGAAGSSVWERCCLGLPSILVINADNQNDIYRNLINGNICYPIQEFNSVIKKGCSKIKKNIDMSFYGVNKIIGELKNVVN